MKLENDPGNLHPSPPRKSYNPFDSDDDAFDSPGLKSNNMYAKESLNSFDLKAFGKSSDTVIFHMDNGEFLWEEDAIGHPLSVDHGDSNVNKVLFGKEGQPYTDKNVTECELPEFVICYKESNIKDIGIDVGVPSSEKLWAQTGDEFLNNAEIGILEAPKSKLDSEWQKDTALNSSGNQVKLDGLNEEALTGRYLVHEFVDTDLLKITELKLDVEDRVLPVGETAPAKEEEIVPSKHVDDDSMEKKSHQTFQDVADKVDVIPELAKIQPPSDLLIVIPMEEDEALADSSDESSLEESADTQDSNNLTYNSKVETRSITFDFGSSTNSKPEKQEDDPQKDEPQHPPALQTMTRKEEEKQKEGEIPSNSILHARLEQRVHGESSFSAGMPVPLPSPSTAISEQLTYSGSISLRSESSAGTASTRSFAFPTTDGMEQQPAEDGKGWPEAFEEAQSMGSGFQLL